MKGDLDFEIKACEKRLETLKELSPALDHFIPKWEAELKRLQKEKENNKLQ